MTAQFFAFVAALAARHENAIHVELLPLGNDSELVHALHKEHKLLLFATEELVKSLFGQLFSRSNQEVEVEPETITKCF